MKPGHEACANTPQHPNKIPKRPYLHPFITTHPTPKEHLRQGRESKNHIATRWKMTARAPDYGFDYKSQRHATERIRFQQGARQRKKSLEL
jgi:hypothetical protein